MKALTLHQPWASLWLTTRKVHETRAWRTHHRGELAVHAGSHPIAARLPPRLEEICADAFGERWRDELMMGAIIGVVNLVDCYSTLDKGPTDPDDFACGDFSADRWLWKRGQFLSLARPLIINGKQGLWNGPEIVLGHDLARHAVGEHR